MAKKTKKVVRKSPKTVKHQPIAKSVKKRNPNKWLLWLIIILIIVVLGALILTFL